MVYGLIIHSAENATDFYFSCYYDPEGNDEHRHLRQNNVIEKVLEEIKYYAEDATTNENVSKKGKEKYLDMFSVFRSKNVNTEVQVDNEGVFRFMSPLFKKKVNIMWKVLNKICYTMIFFSHENMFLVDYSMYTFIFIIRKYLNKAKKNANPEAMFKSDEILTILYHLFPKGQIILFNYEQATILSKKVQDFLDNKQDLYV